MSDTLKLGDLRAANVARQAEWCADEVPDLSFRGNELAGETGEACNIIKKLERERHGWRRSRATVDQLAEELADVVICADLAAIGAGIDLAAAVTAKFNAASEKNGLSIKLDTVAAPAPPVSPAEGVMPWGNAPMDGSKFDIWYPPVSEPFIPQPWRRVTDVYWSNIQEAFCVDGPYGPEEPSPIPASPLPAFWQPVRVPGSCLTASPISAAEHVAVVAEWPRDANAEAMLRKSRIQVASLEAELAALETALPTALARAEAAEAESGEAADKAVDFVFGVLSKALGDPVYSPCDGTETWEGDVAGTVYAILRAAKVIDPETDTLAMDRAEAAEAALAGARNSALRAITALAPWTTASQISERIQSGDVTLDPLQGFIETERCLACIDNILALIQPATTVGDR